MTGKILAKVIEYCKKHVDAKAKDGDTKSNTSDDDLKTWDTEFVKVLDQSTLFELILVSLDPSELVAPWQTMLALIAQVLW